MISIQSKHEISDVNNYIKKLMCFKTQHLQDQLVEGLLSKARMGDLVRSYKGLMAEKAELQSQLATVTATSATGGETEGAETATCPECTRLKAP